MEFNVDKCKVVHFGYNNPQQAYYMAGHQLATVSVEKDLGVYVAADLKCSKQCIEAAKRANRVLGMIARNITFKEQKTILMLYKALVRPHLEYAIQFWNPYLRKDVAKLEGVQRRATKLIPGIRNKSYDQRLRALNLFSLEKRRTRGDMIEVWKIMTGAENVRREDMFVLSGNNRTRGNGLKLEGHRCRLDVAKFWFSNRVVEEWNGLPSDVVSSETLETFKKHLDAFYADRA